MANKDKRRTTRREKVHNSFQAASPLRPQNKTQQLYLQYIEEYPIVVATGFPGTGKTYIPARIAASRLKKNQIENITLTRPNISDSKSLGYFKGTKDEKMMNWLSPVIGALREEFPLGHLGYMLNEDVGQIACCPLETVKGLSWKNSFVIVDEAEDCTLKELRAILTRIGTNSTIVLCGDIQQCGLQKSGLSELLHMRESDSRMAEYVAHIDFNDLNQIVRSDACKQMVLSFNRYQRRQCECNN